MYTLTRRRDLPTGTYEGVGATPDTVKTKMSKKATAMLGKVKAWFKKSNTTVSDLQDSDINNALTNNNAEGPLHDVESVMVRRPRGIERSEQLLTGSLSSHGSTDEEDENQPRPNSPLRWVDMTVPSPAYAKFCKEREERHANFQACLDHASLEDLAEFEVGLFDDGLLQEHQRVLALRGKQAEESVEKGSVTAGEEVKGDGATIFAGKGVEAKHTVVEDPEDLKIAGVQGGQLREHQGGLELEEEQAVTAVKDHLQADGTNGAEAERKPEDMIREEGRGDESV
ncbi:hypothetical protein B0A55_02960 [Friedmanniomyces simplex]|uniref:Uncharacterized protein n=1 Tax=Friedmanniomyces simplex TaxID=329884 RepID=A0A4U0Y4U2_9PEZI|nr:hypothetical protein B0A55_02960 [Friedmanniomyces simplex]